MLLFYCFLGSWTALAATTMRRMIVRHKLLHVSRDLVPLWCLLVLESTLEVGFERRQYSVCSRRRGTVLMRSAGSDASLMMNLMLLDFGVMGTRTMLFP